MTDMHNEIRDEAKRDAAAWKNPGAGPHLRGRRAGRLAETAHGPLGLWRMRTSLRHKHCPA